MKTVFITGATSGIGKEFAARYAQMGYDLILHGRNKKVLKELQESLRVSVEILTADLSQRSECFRLLDAVKDRNIDIFINNAGFGVAGKFLETDLNRELQMLDVNDGAMHVMFKGILKQMQAGNQGTIVNVASSAGLFPGGPYMAAYYAGKAYMVSLTRAVAQELREAGSKVYVCALCPGPVDTNFNNTANVVFSLKGISAEKCVDDCLKLMEKRKTIIVPSVKMRLATSLSHLVPIPLLVKMTGNQQKKKL